MTALLACPVFERLTRAVPAHSLAAFRMGFGALLIWDCWRFIRDNRIWRYWIAPEFQFSYPDFSWFKPLPEAWLELAWRGMGVAALFVMLGDMAVREPDQKISDCSPGKDCKPTWGTAA